MKDTYSRGYKAAALVLLLIELAVLCLPVFGGSTAFLLLKDSGSTEINYSI